MAFFIYDHLQTSKMIDEDPADYGFCRWNQDQDQNQRVKIPKGDKQDIQNKVFIEHCMFPSYKRTVYEGTDPLRKKWVAKACKLGICTDKDKSALKSMKDEIRELTRKYWKTQEYDATRKFMRNGTVA
jgi:hypothetical protein